LYLWLALVDEVGEIKCGVGGAYRGEFGSLRGRSAVFVPSRKP
jgi:hypothetical protein